MSHFLRKVKIKILELTNNTKEIKLEENAWKHWDSLRILNETQSYKSKIM